MAYGIKTNKNYDFSMDGLIFHVTQSLILNTLIIDAQTFIPEIKIALKLL